MNTLLIKPAFWGVLHQHQLIRGKTTWRNCRSPALSYMIPGVGCQRYPWRRRLPHSVVRQQPWHQLPLPRLLCPWHGLGFPELARRPCCSGGRRQPPRRTQLQDGPWWGQEKDGAKRVLLAAFKNSCRRHKKPLNSMETDRTFAGLPWSQHISWPFQFDFFRATTESLPPSPTFQAEVAQSSSRLALVRSLGPGFGGKFWEIEWKSPCRTLETVGKSIALGIPFLCCLLVDVLDVHPPTKIPRNIDPTWPITTLISQDHYHWSRWNIPEVQVLGRGWVFQLSVLSIVQDEHNHAQRTLQHNGFR